ncbi:protein of unknown function [Aminobacter niigataensis]|nr:protein of unknown function [Aminobacter niigataensis]
MPLEHLQACLDGVAVTRAAAQGPGRHQAFGGVARTCDAAVVSGAAEFNNDRARKGCRGGHAGSNVADRIWLHDASRPVALSGTFAVQSGTIASITQAPQMAAQRPKQALRCFSQKYGARSQLYCIRNSPLTPPGEVVFQCEIFCNFPVWC